MHKRILILATTCAFASVAHAQTTYRPLSDWLNAQTNTVFFFDSNNNYAFSDYCGFWRNWLFRNGWSGVMDTNFSGYVSEKINKDGSTHVHVECTAGNCMVWGGNYLNYSNPWIGNRAGQVLYGATPSLGSSFVKVDWDTSDAPGTENLDLIPLVLFNTGRNLKFNVTASLTSTYNGSSPYPAGTPGTLDDNVLYQGGKVTGRWEGDAGYSPSFVHFGLLTP